MNETTKIRDVAIKYCEGCGLDIGCGDEKIRREAIGVDAGTDLVHKGVKEWRDLSTVNIKMMISDLSLFCDNSFDYVYTSHFLEHLENPRAMIVEMARVVRPDGYIIIYLPDRLLYTEPNPDHKCMWTLSEFIILLPESVKVVESIPRFADYSFFIAAQKRK